MQFESEGWALLPRFIDARELAELKPAVDRMLALERPPCMQRPGNDLVPLRWNDEIVTSVLGAEHRIAAIRSLLQASQLAWISGYVSTKGPHSPALWWHQDWWCWDHPVSYTRPASQIALLCYLSETDETSGALRLLPGSHHRSVPLHATLPEAHGDDANALPLAHPALNDDPGQVTVYVRAGDAIIIDYRLLHGTHPNAKPLRRDCILLSFVPDWLRLPDDIKAHLAMHPALPTDVERQHSDSFSYGGLLPHYGGTPVSLAVNRIAPTAFAAS